MNKNILHITDLHLNNFEGTSEHLRRKFFEEYIDNLIEKINLNNLKIDYLILTGDFIHQGKIENYLNITIIVEYLIKELNIKKEYICCNIGNHDYKWKEELENFSNSKDIRKPYNDFITQFNSNVISYSDRYFLKKLDTNEFYLSIDSTLNSIKGKPGKISDSEIDEIISDVLRKNISESSTLLIGCHFPIISDEKNFLASEEDNWTENHVWINGTSLRERISNLKTLHTIWFHGDVHAGDQKKIKNSTYVFTGRFGSDISSISEFPRQCKVIQLSQIKESVYTFNYNFKTHKPNPNLGEWESNGPSDIRIFENSNLVKNIIEVPNQSFIKVIDNEIEDEIMSDITNNNLFKIGRFKTNEVYSSMGWININNLMNQPVLLSRIIEKSVKYLKSTITSNNSECIIIGLEVIGGILASQISVQTNTKNYIFPVRGNGKFHSAEETNKTEMFENIKNIKDAIVFIDVISSGNTVEEFVNTLKDSNNSLRIHVISIITNNNSSRPTEIKNSSTYATFCNKLKVPLIKNIDLPDESIFPIILNFS
ncbi:metallophosphoesterase family protein [Flavobacterium sp.]|uniref:metallophosphoesterase family protein n=1 Tax=Flavobacterium sp. TaxID=239 RepID=UPI0037533EBA